MKILDKEIEFDFYDMEQAEKFEKYTEIASKEINKIDIKNIKQSEYIRKICEIVERCFDEIFGENTSKDIFEDKKNLQLCTRAFKDLVKARIEQDKNISEELEEIQKEIRTAEIKYSPNRATRRAKGSNKK